MRIAPETERLILAQYDHYYSQEFILRSIRDNRVAFLYLTGLLHSPQAAFEELVARLERGESPEDEFRLGRGYSQPRVMSLYGVGTSPFITPRIEPRPLPKWLLSEIRQHLGSSGFEPAEPSRERRDFSFWLMAKLLSDGVFMSAVELARTRWRLGKNPIAWYRRMNGYQRAGFEACRESGVDVHYRDGLPDFSFDGGFFKLSDSATLILSKTGPPIHGVGLGYSGEVRFAVPLDNRRVETYQEPMKYVGFGLPILDYDRDLDALVWLAGGTPGHPSWRRSLETLVWNFQDLPWGSDFDLDEETEHWAVTGRNVLLAKASWCRDGFAYRQCGHVAVVPEAEAHPNAIDPRERPKEPGLILSSRWVDIGEYPKDRHAELVLSIIRYWGRYDPYPGAQNVRSRLRRILRPTMREAALMEIDEEALSDEELADADRRATAAARQRRRRTI